MEMDLFLELDYPFLHISTLEDVYINFGAIQVFLTYLLTQKRLKMFKKGRST